MPVLSFENPLFRASFKHPSSWLKTIRTILIWHALRTHILEQIGWNATRKFKSSLLHGIPIPWWNYAAVQFIDQIVSINSRILEIGGGNSSLYWMERGNYLVTLETNKDWINALTHDKRFNQAKHKVIQISDEKLDSISRAVEDQSFDVVINDGTGNRASIGLFLASMVRPDGILIWDNSERYPDCQSIDQLKISGWKTLEFYGLGPINAYATKTTVLFRNNLPNALH